VDLVRVLTNRSSGRMGAELAAQARALGAEVVLVHGPMAVGPPPGVEAVRVARAAVWGVAVERLAPTVDAAFLAAAVADFRPVGPGAGKLDRREGGVRLELEPVPDLAAGIGGREDRPYLVVFSAEDGPLRERALSKMRAKGADAVVLNDISAEGTGIEADRNEVWVIFDADREVHVPPADKAEVARQVLLAVAGDLLAFRVRRCAPAT
jgi:phosphopantothenoylcysteine decarboxylase/phosphopantothenate--cysteine ligase